MWKALKDHVRSPASCRFESDIETPCLHFLYRDAKQARHLARMRRYYHMSGTAPVQLIGHFVIRVQSIRVQNDGQFRFLHHGTNELLRFRVCGEAGPDGDDGFVARNFGQTSIVKITKACGSSFGCGQRNGHHLRHASGHDGLYILWRGYCDQARAGAKRASGSEDSRAGLA